MRRHWTGGLHEKETQTHLRALALYGMRRIEHLHHPHMLVVWSAEMTARRLCAWHLQNFGCEMDMGRAETKDGSPTHGICQDCMRKSFPELIKRRNGCPAPKPESDIMNKL